MRNLNFYIAVILILTFELVNAQQANPVKVEQGLLQGILENGVTCYKGVPYAAPPVGELRWCAPRPPANWEGVRKADKFADNPIQKMVKEYGPWTAEYQPQGNVSEDCLYLNIWTAENTRDKKLPVLMYIPGGAFTGGSGNVPVYNGENLAKKGLVVVTINYRVGVIGFLAHPELTKESEHNSSGNYGVLDQLAALEWIKKNISAFGGDPSRITIMGQSAGAASVNYLTASPLAKGSFIRAIAQSGTGLRNGPGENLKSAEQTGERFAKELGAKSIAELRAISADNLLSASDNKYRFAPIVDGWYLPKSVDEIFSAGEQNDVATLTGWVADEGSFNESYGKVPAEEFRQQIKQRFGAESEEIMKLYPSDNETESAESQKKFAREMSLYSMLMWAKIRKNTAKTNIYTYIFTHQQPGDTKERYLAFHSSELPYIFNSLNHAPRPWETKDREIAETMSNYWVNFISTGNPNGTGLPKWTEYTAGSDQTMELGDRMGMRPIAGNEKIEVLKKLFKNSE
ncbi:MAG: carboxylesterase family protein [Ignavibacteria bacterium]|nr:carboxylesterase family protein [Ignavibacteria bacterium]